jgi:hypothetical protein
VENILDKEAEKKVSFDESSLHELDAHGPTGWVNHYHVSGLSRAIFKTPMLMSEHNAS